MRIFYKILYAVVLFFSVTLPVFAQEHAARYISLAPSTTEILFSLGLDSEIVGVSSYCNYPPQALTKPKMGEFSHPNIERILSFKADYIFCTGLEQSATIAELKRLGQNVYVADPSTIDELVNSILEIGKITHKEYESQIVAKQMLDRIERIKEKVMLVPPGNRQKVFIEIWHDPLILSILSRVS